MPVYIPWKDTEQEKKQEDSSDVLLKCNVTGNAKKQLGGVCVWGEFWGADQYVLSEIGYGASEKNKFCCFVLFYF